jgi:bifunctional DNA-binding transcriptional regulator/antitoxin component of YhaV-PrlF toxin-antitoxin module
MKWTVHVQEDPETGELILPFADEMIEAVGWKEGDIIEWIDNKDGTWTMRKIDGTSTDTVE